MDALGRRHVDLDPVAEAEEALGSLAGPDEGVERGQQRPRRRGTAQARGPLSRQVGGLPPALDPHGDEAAVLGELDDSGL